MKKIKIILIVLAALISVLIILPFLIPVETYLHQAEVIASEKLKTKVQLSNGHLAFLPSIRLVIDDIKVGDQGEVSIEQIAIVPTLSSLFTDFKTVDIYVINPVIKKSAFEIFSTLTSDAPNESAASLIDLRNLYIDDLMVLWPDKKLPLMDVEASFVQGTQLQSAKLETQDGHVQMHVIPEGDSQKITLEAKDWISPISLPVFIDSAKITGMLSKGALDITHIDLSLYQGKLTGDAKLTWGSGWKLTGKLDVNKLAVEKPSRLVSQSVYLSGNLFGKGQFSATAKDVGALAEKMQANFKFYVNEGVLHGVDLMRMASLLVRQNQKGDMTQFEELSGVLKTSGRQYHLKDLKVSSGLLVGSGQIKVMPNKTLDGEVEVEIKNSASLTAIPLIISGTVKKPVIYPSKAAIAGAVAGTAILGPGVGTSLGMKAGSALNSIKNSFSSQNQ